VTTLSRVLSRQPGRGIDGVAVKWVLIGLALQLALGALLGGKGPAFAAVLLLPFVFLVFGDRAIFLALGALLVAVANVPVQIIVPGIELQFNVAALCIPLLGLAWLALRLSSDGVSRLLTGSGLAFAALLGVGAFSIAANLDRLEPTHALAGLGPYVTNALAFFMAADAMKGGRTAALKRIRWFLAAGAAGGAVTVVWTIINFLSGSRTFWKSNMISAGMGVGNLSLFCTVGAIVALSSIVCSRQRSVKAVGALALAAFVVALMLSWSRAWFLGAVVGMAVVLGVRSRAALAGYLILLLCIGLLFPSLASAIRDLYSERSAPGTYDRFDLWADGLRIAAENPAIGVGLSGYEQHAGYDSRRLFASAHNVYIQTFAETGILGLLALLAIFALVLREAWGLYRESDVQLIRSLALAVVALIPGIFVAGMFGHETMASFANGELAFVRGSFYLWFLAGCVTGIYRLYRRRHGSQFLLGDGVK